MNFWGFRPYVPVAARRAQAAKIEKFRKKGRAVSPVVVEDRKIAKSFWGKAWCGNLERYSDYANRLPRGRTYVSNGSLIDLQIGRGKVEALVSGSKVYNVKIDIKATVPERWKSICADCAGSVGSLVELQCANCGHSADVNVDTLPDTITVPEAGRRLRCSQCGGKTISTRPA
jgi:hypothetical protein